MRAASSRAIATRLGEQNVAYSASRAASAPSPDGDRRPASLRAAAW
jgi:hypothetical protein